MKMLNLNGKSTKSGINQCLPADTLGCLTICANALLEMHPVSIGGWSALHDHTVRLDTAHSCHHHQSLSPIYPVR